MTKKTKTIELQVADAVLDAPKIIVVGGETYEVKPITLRTLIRLSAMISYLPMFSSDLTREEKVAMIIDRARECEALGDIVALMLLQRGPNDGSRKKRSEFRKLAQEALDLRPSQSHTVIDTALAPEEVGYFFGVITFLSAANILRATREVEQTTETDQTASGR